MGILLTLFNTYIDSDIPNFDYLIIIILYQIIINGSILL